MEKITPDIVHAKSSLSDFKEFGIQSRSKYNGVTVRMYINTCVHRKSLLCYILLTNYGRLGAGC